MNSAEKAILALSEVRKSYGGTEVLHGITLSLVPGEFASLVGPSGSGKSTLLNILGLLDRPTSGELCVRGQFVSELSEAGLTDARGRTLGFVFQFHHLLPALTAEQNVMLPLAAESGRMTPEAREKARALLESVGLRERSQSLASEFSGGQQQRIAIARALVHRPALVLADEPTGNLDTETGEQIFRLMRSIHERDGTSFLIVTHDPRLAARCDRRISLVDGRISEDSTPIGRF